MTEKRNFLTKFGQIQYNKTTGVFDDAYNKIGFYDWKNILDKFHEQSFQCYWLREIHFTEFRYFTQLLINTDSSKIAKNLQFIDWGDGSALVQWKLPSNRRVYLVDNA